MIIAVFDISVAFFHGKVRNVIFVVPPKDLRKKGKIWRLLKSLCGTRDASQGRIRRSSLPEKCGGAVFVLGRDAGSIWCALRRRFIFGIPDDRANDLEQLMREVFKMKICECIGPGFLTSAEFLHRKEAWNAEGFSWLHDPKHTLAMADGSGFNGKK